MYILALEKYMKLKNYETSIVSSSGYRTSIHVCCFITKLPQHATHFLCLYDNRPKYRYHYCLKNCECRSWFPNSEDLNNYIFRTSGFGAHTASYTMGISSFRGRSGRGFASAIYPVQRQGKRKGTAIFLTPSPLFLSGRL
jgi:hypothetical protein